MDKPMPAGLKTLFLVHFIVALVFGLLFFVFPSVWGSLAGSPVTSHELYRMIGAAMLAFGASSWLAYRAKGWESVRILVVTEIVWTALGALVTLYYLIRWAFPPLYWLTAVVLAAFAMAFAWFYMRK
jgi:uncharacterized protein YjeT (DUF2065 family)